MMQPDQILSIDQGTASTRAILFDRNARAVAIAQRGFVRANAAMAPQYR
ncbi:MAG TPA: hypothetical protein VHU79_00565 [Sphingomicrobium sp.]|jgi:glycerol kinase|nr:hypothetical protein [Sphingomicrobium sp.]